MMTKLMIDEKYAKELDKAEIDHHKPTAGAMLGHVLSNLFIENIRLTQAGIYAKSPVKCEYLREIAQKEVEYFFKISDLLLDENEIVPSTTEEFLKYHKFITEDQKPNIGLMKICLKASLWISSTKYVHYASNQASKQRRKICFGGWCSRTLRLQSSSYSQLGR